jgi:hypothetical protein
MDGLTNVKSDGATAAVILWIGDEASFSGEIHDPA